LFACTSDMCIKLLLTYLLTMNDTSDEPDSVVTVRRALNETSMNDTSHDPDSVVTVRHAINETSMNDTSDEPDSSLEPVC